MADDFSAAVSAATTEASGEPAAPEPQPAVEAAVEGQAPTTSEPAPEPPAHEEPAPTDEEMFFNPTAADLAIINANPQLQKVYKSMQRGLTKKTQGFSQREKELSEKAALAEWIQTNPDAALNLLAQIQGKQIGAPPRTETSQYVDPLVDRWTKSIGPDAAAILRPLFEDTAKAMFDGQIKPLREQTEQLQRAAAERGIAAATREFGAAVSERGEPWDDDVQLEMSKLVGVVQPGENTSMPEYLSLLHQVVVAQRAQKSGLRREISRLRAAKDEAPEPQAGVRPTQTAASSISAKLSEKDAVAAAVEAARQQLGVGRR